MSCAEVLWIVYRQIRDSVVDLDATDGVAFQHLAQVYEALGEKAKADWAQKEAERWNDE